jgi:excisionase family DNA binding protein
MRRRRNRAQLAMPWSPDYAISAAEAADLLDVSIDVVQKLARGGEIEGYKLRAATSPWRVNRESLEAYMVSRFHPADDCLLPWPQQRSISVPRAAKALAVSPLTVQRMIQAGELKAYQVRPMQGSPWRIDRDSLEEYISKIHEANGLDTRF